VQRTLLFSEFFAAIGRGAMSTPQPNLASIATSPMRQRNWRLLIFGLIGLCLLFVAGYIQRSNEQTQIRAEIATVKADIALARQRQILLVDEVAQLDAPARIAVIARDDLGYVLPEDKPVVVVAAPIQAAPAATPGSAVPTEASGAPNWQQWLQVIGIGVSASPR
jgi:cell division protein FtsB